MGEPSNYHSDDDEYIFQIGGAVLSGMERVMTMLQEEDGEVKSQRRTRTPITRDRVGAHERLMSHYFNDDCLYPPNVFPRRFRMQKPLFLRIVNDVTSMSTYMQQRPNAIGTLGFSELQKCAVSIRQLAYGSVSDSWDEYFQMSERVAFNSLDEFCSCIILLYGRRFMVYLVCLEVWIVFIGSGMVAVYPTMGCTHPTMILEAATSQDLWFWHAYFGPAGSNNDLNVLQVSPVFDHILNGTAPDTSFMINETPFRYGYYLIDGIYHDSAVFVKTIQYPGDPMRDKYKRAQERARKDIERAFGAIKKRWRILKGPARSTDRNKVARVMYTCCILHNMILEDEGKAICTYVESENVIPNPPPIQIGSLQSLAIRRKIRCNDTHHILRHSLAQHLWTVDHIDLNVIPQDDSEEFFN